MGTNMAFVDLTRCGCAEISFGKRISKTGLLEIDAPRSVKRFWIRGCWTRRNEIALAQAIKREENVIVEEVSSLGALTRSRVIGMLGLDQSFRHGNVATQQGRRFIGRAVPLVSLADASPLSQTTVDVIDGERNENGFSELADSSSSSSEETNTSGNSTLSTTESMEPWFPYKDCFKLDDKRTLTSTDVISMLCPILGDERKQRIKEVVANRTYSVCIAIEGLLDFGNISAITRSAEALGFQSAHVITNGVKKKRYKGNRTVNRGTEKWLDTEIWDDTSECIATLRKRGYRIAVTRLAPDTVSIHDIDWTIPTAVFFGNEFKGVSEEAINESDIQCSIPMGGMVESLNVSVAAGILMQIAVLDRITRLGTHGDLSAQQRQILVAEFCLRHNRRSVPLSNCLLDTKA